MFSQDINQPLRMIPIFPENCKVVTDVFTSNDVMPCCTQIIENKETKEETNPFATNNGQTKDEDFWLPGETKC